MTHDLKDGMQIAAVKVPSSRNPKSIEVNHTLYMMCYMLQDRAVVISESVNFP